MITQRKIRHLLVGEGEGASFSYREELAQPFDLMQPILVTEKVDGSTMQALGGEPFKRYDRFKARDPRKHTATEEERYELRPCSRANPAERWYLDAFDAHAEAFSRVPSDVCIYFEAMGERIGARYPRLEPTVRVFDASRDGAWLPFVDTVQLATLTGLPLVAHETRVFMTLNNLLLALACADSYDDDLPEHRLEGWVLRQGDLVAKIRKADLAKMERA